MAGILAKALSAVIHQFSLILVGRFRLYRQLEPSWC